MRSVTAATARQDRPALVGVAGSERLAAGVRHVVVGVPEPVPPLGVGQPGQFEDLGDGAGGVCGHTENFIAPTVASPR